MTSRFIIIFGIVLTLLGKSVTAGGMSYLDHQVFSHGYVDFHNAGALDIFQYPFALTGKKLTLQTSYRSLYGLSELSDNRAGLTYSFNKYQLAAGFSNFGKSNYFQQTGMSLAGNYTCREISFGLSLIYSRISFNEKYNSQSAIIVNSGLMFKVKNISGYGLIRAINKPSYIVNKRDIPTEAELGASYKNKTGLDSQIKFLFIQYQKPTAEISQDFQMVEYAHINWALVLAPVRVGAGLKFEHRKMTFEYKFSHHPVLGLTHSVLLGIGRK
ncbi:MAG: hypothetical protein V3V99_12110 [candidate division Zixibacteria bacterium]